MKDLNLHVTLWPSFPHFGRFATDYRLSSIRLNSAMLHLFEIDKELETARSIKNGIPLFFDVKGRQLRVVEPIVTPERLELKINHPISVPTPTIVLFKAGADKAVLKEIKDGTHLIFDGGPEFMVKAGESFHIRHPELKVSGPIFTDLEKEKIEKVRKAGFNQFYLSYVEDQRDVDEFRELIGPDPIVIAKIESKAGLNYVANQFKPRSNFTIMGARGDLYVEIERPHQILEAMKLIIKKDPRAFAGSRMLLSVVKSPVPECADFSELAWLYDIGYRNMLLCDELCLKEDLLARAVNAFNAFSESYTRELIVEDPWEK
jgi:pyruvate kinase